MLACVVYAFAAGSFYRLNVKDRYQSRFLASGIAAAILMSSPHPMVSLPHPVIFKSWLPVMITLTLLLSTVFHQRNPEWRTRSAEASEDTDEKHSNLQIWENDDIFDMLLEGKSEKEERRLYRKKRTFSSFSGREVLSAFPKESLYLIGVIWRCTLLSNELLSFTCRAVISRLMRPAVLICWNGVPTHTIRTLALAKITLLPLTPTRPLKLLFIDSHRLEYTKLCPTDSS